MRKLLLVTPLVMLCVSCKIVKGIKEASRSNKTEIQTVLTSAHTLPFEFTGNKILVKVKLRHEGKEETLTLVLDTGAPTLLSERSSRKYHVAYADSSSDKVSTPVGGEIIMKKYSAKDVMLDVAGISIIKPHLRIMPMNNAFADCNNVDGILGVDILSRFTLSFDFQKKEIVFYAKETLPQDIDKYTHIIDFNNYSPTQKTPEVSLTVNHAEDDFIWDSGFNGALYMRSNSKKKFDKWLMAHPESARYQTYGATSDVTGRSATTDTMYYFFTDSIFNGKELLSVGKMRSSHLLNTKLSLSRNNIGTGFMKNYKVVISWDKKKIYLLETMKPNTPAVKLPELLAGYDAASKSIVVRMIGENSKAYKNGIRTADKVVSIDGTSAEELIRSNSECSIDNIIATRLNEAKRIEVLKGDKKQPVTVE